EGAQVLPVPDVDGDATSRPEHGGADDFLVLPTIPGEELSKGIGSDGRLLPGAEEEFQLLAEMSEEFILKLDADVPLVLPMAEIDLKFGDTGPFVQPPADEAVALVRSMFSLRGPSGQDWMETLTPGHGILTDDFSTLAHRFGHFFE